MPERKIEEYNVMSSTTCVRQLQVLISVYSNRMWRIRLHAAKWRCNYCRNSMFPILFLMYVVWSTLPQICQNCGKTLCTDPPKARVLFLSAFFQHGRYYDDGHSPLPTTRLELSSIHSQERCRKTWRSRWGNCTVARRSHQWVEDQQWDMVAVDTVMPKLGIVTSWFGPHSAWRRVELRSDVRRIRASLAWNTLDRLILLTESYLKIQSRKRSFCRESAVTESRGTDEKYKVP